MARVVVSGDAQRDLIRTRSLPADTNRRLRASLLPLRTFPQLGAALKRPFESRRFILGPWRRMIIVYRHYPERDLVAVVAIVDGRTSSSPLANR